MATKKKASKKAAPKKEPAQAEDATVEAAAAPEAAEEFDAAEEPEVDAPPEDPEPAPEFVKFDRNPEEKLSDEESKAIRAILRRGHKAIEAIEEVLDQFQPGPERAVKNALKKLTEELESLAPPEPRKCKEYKRAIALARKGEMGIHPDDVMRFCRCSECHALREKAGVPHPLAPRQV